MRDVTDGVNDVPDAVAQNILWALRDGVVLGVYEPMGNLVKILVVDGSPSMAFLVNLVLHVSNCALTRVLCKRALTLRTQQLDLMCRDVSATSSDLAADLATALFAGHPICVESVAWSSCQPVLLATWFAAAAMCLHNHPSDASSHRKWMPAWLLLFACLSKATAITVPVYSCILDVESIVSERGCDDRPRRRFLKFLQSVRCNPIRLCITLFSGGNKSASSLCNAFRKLLGW